jgi:hypothetical protein
MKYIVAVLLFLSTAFAMEPAIVKVHGTTLKIAQSTLSSSSGCSATAIGPHALITATHCELPTDSLSIRGEEQEVTIVGRIRDELDHSIYLLSGVTFAEYAPVNTNDPLEMSEDVFILGNPYDQVDIYRKGYVAGYRRPQVALGQGEPDMTLFDLNGYPGDSGAALFNKAGEIIALVSIVRFHMEQTKAMDLTGSYHLQFTQEQLDTARKFKPAK